MTDTMHVEVLREWPAVCALAGQWNSLLVQGGVRNVFLSWEWIHSWQETICPQADLHVLAVRDGGQELLGLAPLHRHRLRLLGLGSFRCLRVLGSDRLSGAEYPDLLFRPGAEAGVVAAVARHLGQHREEWDCLWLANLADWQGAGQRFTQMAAQGGLRFRSRPRDFSAIALPADYETYERSLSKNARHHLRRCTKKLLSAPGAELVVCDDRMKLEAMLAAHVRLNRGRWQSVGEGGTFRFAPREAFYRRLSEAALAAGSLGFYGLRVDGDFRALWFGFVGGPTYYSLSLSYDVEFENQHRTGAANVLYGRMLPLLMARGVREFDHLGGVSEYKTRWGAARRDGSDALLCAPTFKGLLLHASSVWPGGRFLRLDTPDEPPRHLPEP